MILKKETRIAIHQMINQSEGFDPKDIAQVTGDAHKTICNYGNPNMENHDPSLKKFEAIMLLTQNPVVLKVWAHMLGFVLMPAGGEGSHRQMTIVEALLQMNSETGKANQKVFEVLEDGMVTPQEYAEASEILNRIIENAKAADMALSKQMHKFTQKEKA
ncbi:phage regulatory CII family protein [Acinetobacter radioresistens]|uniref:phage regulatory CII family protein n=1 Tax=Acinetobacter radioresistens TaxID=40216 RepID=UPI000DACB7EA|nr:phage regulatory CII family protein [Acinetobacter radioresistens]AWV86174.1 XRE family transcriptional regulator [Acinetobacter radioresistens]MCX0327688.1 XRE family transcriptional regulator [Acinetobacter radioresistens]